MSKLNPKPQGNLFGDPDYVSVQDGELKIHHMRNASLDSPPADLNYKPRLWIGIDPGKEGGIVAMDERCVMEKWITPRFKDEIDLDGFYDIFSKLINSYTITVIIEDVHSIFGVSAAANFGLGFIVGATRAIIKAHGLKYVLVPPKDWQAEIWVHSDKIFKPLKEGKKRPTIDTKATSAMAAKRLFPKFDFRKSDSIRVTKDHDGIIDAALIAEYGRRKNL
jgi:hypothetical protein